MAAPTQEFPPWLTPVVSVVTDEAGALSTSTSIMFLPLTYFGPSIPLGPEWTFGGSFPPVSTVTVTVSASNPITTSLATPASSATPSSVTQTSLPSLSSSPSQSVTSTVPTPSPSQSVITMQAASSLSRGQLIGVIVAGILGVVFLLVLILSFYLFFKNRKNRPREARFSMVTPIEEEYFVVQDPEQPHSPGEGSPRQSGEEVDPFLQARRSRGSNGRGVQARPLSTGSVPVASGSRPTATAGDSSLRSSSTNSGYGVVLDRQTYSTDPVQEDFPFRGRILSPQELSRLEEESVLPRDTDHGHTTDLPPGHSPLMPPPRILDPEGNVSRTSFKQPSGSVTHVARASVDLEESYLSTARRVRAGDLVPRNMPSTIYEKPEHGFGYPSPLPPTPARSNSITRSASWLLGSIANLGRRSWFSRDSPPRHGNAQPVTSAPFGDEDLEAGQALLSPVQMAESNPLRNFGVPILERPISHVSAKTGTSGGTLYHDAHSSLPSTPPLVPPPRALTPAYHGHSPEPWATSSLMGPSPVLAQSPRPPVYDDPVPAGRHSPEGPLLPPGIDILDMPVPPALSPFSTSGSSSLPSLRPDTSTVSSNTLVRFAPGTAASASPKAPGSTFSRPSAGSLGVDSITAATDGAGISIEVLEEEPPQPGEGWRSMAAVVNHVMADGRRTTFGMPGFLLPDRVSEDGSLGSMRSHLGAGSSRSAGSSPASRRDGSDSNSSASSKSQAARSTLSHSGSISSDGRRRHRPIASSSHLNPTSPTLSAFGHPGRVSGTGSIGSAGAVSVSLSTSMSLPTSATSLPSIPSLPAITTPPPAAYVPMRAVVGEEMPQTPPDAHSQQVHQQWQQQQSQPFEPGQAHLRPAQPGSPMSTSLRFSVAPWVGGLGDDWTPTP
ncbi:hypothetical protein BDN72DRAFT_894082 [Pluteus cervinus]|uniref:Uncharacterized protein n=1 Tax=Pluteus cervinus TaxID=181527 RepID=A0ACD3B5S5_9AGAR|nr:hypothetical protein BDN72DRAFT_894082 [Pluteus cervinus]